MVFQRSPHTGPYCSLDSVDVNDIQRVVVAEKLMSTLQDRTLVHQSRSLPQVLCPLHRRCYSALLCLGYQCVRASNVQRATWLKCTLHTVDDLVFRKVNPCCPKQLEYRMSTRE